MDAHDVAAAGEHHERHERERDAEGQHDLAEHERAGGVDARWRGSTMRGDHRDRAAQQQRDADVDEAGHHDLPGVGADARRGGARGEQRDRERERSGAADEVAELRVSLWDRAQARERGGVEELRGDGQHRHVDEAGEAERDDHVEALEAQHAAALAVVAAGHAAVGQRRVQVDHVRHHGRADDPDREVQRAGAVQARAAARAAIRGRRGRCAASRTGSPRR